MKRLLIVIVLLAAPAWAEEPVQLARMSGPMLGAGGSAAAACDTSKLTCDAAYVSDYNLGSENQFKYCATKFITGDTGFTACRVTVKALAVETPAWKMSAHIYADDGEDKPTGPALASSSEVSAAIGSDEVDVSFTFTVPVVLAATTIYHLAFAASAIDASNYVALRSTNSCTPEVISKSGDGSTWNTESKYRSLRYVLYSQ